VYTSLLLADAVQRREIALDTPVSELLPVASPCRSETRSRSRSSTWRCTSRVAAHPAEHRRARGRSGSFAGYGENELYGDLLRTELIGAPGAQLNYSPTAPGCSGSCSAARSAPATQGAGDPRAAPARAHRYIRLGAAGARLGAAGARVGAAGARVGAAGARVAAGGARGARAPGTTDDWSARCRGRSTRSPGRRVVSSARDLLRLIDAEPMPRRHTQPLRRAMKLTQEPQLDRSGDNVSLAG